MSANSIVQRALTNRWLHEQGVPDLRTLWIALHYGPQGSQLVGTAGCGPA